MSEARERERKWRLSLNRCFALHFKLNSYHKLEVSLAMACIRISLLFLFTLIAQSVTQDIRSFSMSKMTGWQFQCATTTCLPFVTVTVSRICDCQTACLAQVQCQAASFQQSTSNCELFTNIKNQDENMSADVETVTMIVISGTRMPPG
jgi:hypothetical protein